MARSGAPTGKWPATPPHLKSAEATGDPRQVGAKIVVRRSDVPDVEIALVKPEFVIGRQPDVDLTLDDELVSRRHARLTMDARGYFKLEDLGSRNGIGYAGRTLRRLNLIDGDKFTIGKAEFTFHAKMDRFKKPVLPPVRKDSVFMDIEIPRPEPEPPAVEEVPEPEAGAPAPSEAREPEAGSAEPES